MQLMEMTRKVHMFSQLSKSVVFLLLHLHLISLSGKLHLTVQDSLVSLSGIVLSP